MCSWLVCAADFPYDIDFYSKLLTTGEVDDEGFDVMDLFVLRVRGKGSGCREKRGSGLSLDSSGEPSPAESEVESEVDATNDAKSVDSSSIKRRSSSSKSLKTEQRFVFEVDDGDEITKIFNTRLLEAKAKYKLRQAQNKVRADLEMDLESVSCLVSLFCIAITNTIHQAKVRCMIDLIDKGSVKEDKARQFVTTELDRALQKPPENDRSLTGPLRKVVEVQRAYQELKEVRFFSLVDKINQLELVPGYEQFHTNRKRRLWRL